MADEPIVTQTNPPVETPAPTAPPVSLEALMSDAVIALQVRDMIQSGVKAGITAELAKIKRETEVAQLCADLTGGSADKPNGLPVDKSELEKFMLTLSDEQRQTCAGLLDKIRVTGLVHFEELGHAHKLKNLAQLPDEIKPILRDHIAAGQSLEKFFEYNQADLGAMSDYDLAEFQKKES